MDDNASVKQRRRPVTACSECHRRKQKCDRQKPCNHCTARGVSSHCSYDDASASQRIAKFRKHRPLAASGKQISSLTPDSSPEDGGLPDEIGYSSFYGNDAYEDMKQLLEDEDIFQAATAITTRTQRYDPSKKFWALTAQLPPTNVQRELVDLFFSEIHWRYSTLERAYFDQWYAQWTELDLSPMDQIDIQKLPRHLQYFPALIFQLCALGMQFVDVTRNGYCPPGLRATVSSMAACEDLSYKYSDLGTELLSLLGRHRTDSVAITAYILKAAVLKNFGHGVESWYTVGDAIRQAQELDFHRHVDISQIGDNETDIKETLRQVWDDEYKRRLWVTLYTWDSSMAVVLGRPRMINKQDCNIKPPLDCAFPENPSKTIPLASGSTASPFSIVAFRYQLAQKIHEIRFHGADQRCPSDYAVVLSLHDQVTSLLTGLPLFLRPNNPDTSWDATCPYLPIHREEVVNNINAVLMALHRPHINMHVRSRQAALEAGLACLGSQQRIAQTVSPQQNRYFGCAFYTINAVLLVSAVTLLYPPDDLDQQSVIASSLTQAICRLTAIEGVNLIAKSGINIARRCYRKVQACFDESSSSRASAGPEMVLSLTPELSTSNHGSHDTSNIGSVDLSNVQFDPQIDSFATLDGTDFDMSYWISQINQIPDTSGTDPTWDHLFASGT